MVTTRIVGKKIETTKYAKSAKMTVTIVFKEQSPASKRSVYILGQSYKMLKHPKSADKQLVLLINCGHYPKFEHGHFLNQTLSRVSRIS